MRRVLLPAGLGVLALLSCVKHPTGFPDPMGYNGFIEEGWQALAQGRQLDALGWFQQAIALDVYKPDGYLGAGVSCVFLEDYWETADSYFQIAVQQDLGRSAVVQHLNQSRTQDTLWTVFQCIDPDLPQDSLQWWLSLTADSGAIWVGQRIYGFLTSQGLDTSLLFRFNPTEGEPVACLDLSNLQTGGVYDADSIHQGFVHVTVPVRTVPQGTGVFYRTWIMADQTIRYDVAMFDAGPGSGQITKDALAAWTLLQEVRGTEGDLLQAAACSRGLLWIDPGFRFGAGDPVREEVFSLNGLHVVAACASHAFQRGKFAYAWFMCREAGYGLDLDPNAPGFLLDLLEVLVLMQSGR